MPWSLILQGEDAESLFPVFGRSAVLAKPWCFRTNVSHSLLVPWLLPPGPLPALGSVTEACGREVEAGFYLEGFYSGPILQLSCEPQLHSLVEHPSLPPMATEERPPGAYVAEEKAGMPALCSVGRWINVGNGDSGLLSPLSLSNCDQLSASNWLTTVRLCGYVGGDPKHCPHFFFFNRCSWTPEG